MSTHRRVWELLGVDQPAATWGSDDFYPDALPCLAARGVCASALSGTRSTEAEDLPVREHVDLVGSSARWGVEKPAARVSSSGSSPEFGVDADEIAYVRRSR